MTTKGWTDIILSLAGYIASIIFFWRWRRAWYSVLLGLFVGLMLDGMISRLLGTTKADIGIGDTANAQTQVMSFMGF